jgi:hypothetical protein
MQGVKIMQLDDLISSINLVSDEEYDSSEVVPFLNDAISKINIECDSVFPYITPGDTEYTAFPDKWQRSLFIPFGLGRIKQLDSSQFEYTDAYSEFSYNLVIFKSKYNIPEQYTDNSVVSNPLQTDFSSEGGGW